MKIPIWTLGLLVTCGTAVGCGSTPVPKAQVASTQTAVQSAQQSGADRVPGAKTYLNQAEQELNAANAKIEKGKNEEASRLLSRAQVDAQLASSVSREAQEKAAAQAMLQRVHSTSMQLQQPSSR